MRILLIDREAEAFERTSAGKEDLRFTEWAREDRGTVLTDISHKEKTHEAAWCIIPSVLRVPVRVCMERWLLYEPGCGGRDREDDRYTLDAFKYISLLDIASRDPPCNKVSATSSERFCTFLCLQAAASNAKKAVTCREQIELFMINRIGWKFTLNARKFGFI